MATDLDHLLNPPRLWSRDEVLTTKCVPRTAGVYAWYFRDVPDSVPTERCIVHRQSTLLYIGIAPQPPSKDGNRVSSQTLFLRIRRHMRGDASRSTLRLTLGCLLGFELRRTVSGRRNFADREDDLSAWMGQNAAVCWVETSEPWNVESELLGSESVPLNLDQNQRHPFHPALTAIRLEAKRRADELPVWRAG